MIKKYPPINPKFQHFIHGGDYNPEQWQETPEIWDEDMRLMKLAHCNTMTVGVFSWVSLEPEEGKFTFSWLDTIMDKLADNGMYAVLATPSGARPAWMSKKYPEVLRINEYRVRNLYGNRHNHCFASPVYREKCRIINQKLAERYKDHPALSVWHISNEYSGECYCELCQEAFRQWLKKKYRTLDKLNHAWWTRFWSHTFTDWSQIESPAPYPYGEQSIHGLNLDWKRFVTYQTIDFLRNEIAPIRKITPKIPVTTNFMGTFQWLDYWKFVDELDVVALDSYPRWHGKDEDWLLGANVSFTHDIYRSMKGGRPFMLMESTPSATNWAEVCKVKRPGMHLLSSIQAVAHGADTVQYFQWRKSRGSCEKFHGAVIDHCGHENTRVFKDVVEVGKTLKKLDAVLGTTVKPEAAVIYDWENNWAIEDAQGPIRYRKDYLATCQNHYRQFWMRGIPVDVINMDRDFSRYKLIIAPMLYMIKQGVAQRLDNFVHSGGTFVATYWTGIVDDNDLCFLGGFPGPLRKLLGIWSEEIDALYDIDKNYVVPVKNNPLKLSGEYEARDLCDLIHAETAKVLAKYKQDFYAGRPALTVNKYGRGEAYYIASRDDERFLSDFYQAIIKKLNIKRVIDSELPQGVSAQLRTDGKKEFIFLMNFKPEKQEVQLGRNSYRNLLNGKTIEGKLPLPSYGIAVLQKNI
jgi:beta-galactosidase